ncbi:MAG TPA: ABC transporter permease [Candidatus Brocadiia bacterium]|nr:ABC transporter permease [Candidatus Brocadiia bacterium]
MSATAKNRLAAFIGRSGVFAALGLLLLLGGAVSGDFYTRVNLMNALKTVTLLGIVAVGVSFVAYSGNFVDLSLPLIMALSGIVSVTMLRYGIAVSLACGIAAGMCVGAVNGLVVGYLRLNPIIWTLAMNSVADGFIRWVYGGQQVYADEKTDAGRLFTGLYHAEIFGTVPLITVILILLAIAGQAIMKRTGYGAGLKLAGSAPEVARLTGVPVSRYVFFAFLISAFASSVGGLLLTSFNKVGAAYIGEGYGFSAITAVVIGGVTLAGGRGSVIGAMGGVLVMGLLANIMSLAGIGMFKQSVIQGAVFILVVGLQSYARRRTGVEDA